jgi:hypothetical protein
VSAHHLDPAVIYNILGQHSPALRAAPGDTVILQTLGFVCRVARERVETAGR